MGILADQGAELIKLEAPRRGEDARDARRGTLWQTPAGGGGPAPAIGQHTEEILRELGMEEENGQLRGAGIVA